MEKTFIREQLSGHSSEETANRAPPGKPPARRNLWITPDNASVALVRQFDESPASLTGAEREKRDEGTESSRVRTEGVLVRLPDPKRPSVDFRLLQQWEGTVTSGPPYTDSFTAVLRDLTNPACPDEEVEFSVGEVSADDRALLAAGAIFYWTMGYSTTSYGQIRRVSFVRFRRLPAWSKADIRHGAERARKLLSLLPNTASTDDEHRGGLSTG